MESCWPGCSPECSSIGARGIRDGLRPLPHSPQVFGGIRSQKTWDLWGCLCHPPRQIFLVCPRLVVSCGFSQDGGLPDQ